MAPGHEINRKFREVILGNSEKFLYTCICAYVYAQEEYCNITLPICLLAALVLNEFQDFFLEDPLTSLIIPWSEGTVQNFTLCTCLRWTRLISVWGNSVWELGSKDQRSSTSPPAPDFIIINVSLLLEEQADVLWQKLCYWSFLCAPFAWILGVMIGVTHYKGNCFTFITDIQW